MCCETHPKGDAWHEYTPGLDKEKSFGLLDAFLAAGGVSIDTASGYNVSSIRF